jgi:hypothetical protein
MNKEIENQIRELLGKSCGLNADWSADAWHIQKELYLVDFENGDVGLMRKGQEDDYDAVVVAEAVASDWRKLVQQAISL